MAFEVRDLVLSSFRETPSGGRGGARCAAGDPGPVKIPPKHPPPKPQCEMATMITGGREAAAADREEYLLVREQLRQAILKSAL
jgi:hypothetical protein